jgi:hypothetical protein
MAGGLCAFTVSPSAIGSVRNYIANQEAHHKKQSFVDELKELLSMALSMTRSSFYERLHLFEVRLNILEDPVVYASLRSPATLTEPSRIQNRIGGDIQLRAEFLSLGPTGGRRLRARIEFGE